ncbi:uncharacterized protein FIBRA_08265 [Fibroporia radiculosa]|uniref:DUF6533 domain-containing protein n=1 Tax=Fibroporia radiculosa TaxID=599839 RepID=J4IC95_9APHY|nr:uncharacterized protein FIBRA_08265 [Fibroporia radiculosa]CCM06021.1 predicted protein [Fibroporia radiculosa]
MLQGNSSAGYLALVETDFNNMLLANFCTVAAMMLLLYDYILTFAQEIQCIWRRKFSGATVLFFLNRYLSIIYRILMLLVILPWQYLPQQTADDVITIMLDLILAVFTSLRLYAIWNRDRRILIAVILLGLVSPAANIFYYTTLQEEAAPPPLYGCAVRVHMSASAGEMSVPVGLVVMRLADNTFSFAIFNCVFAICSDAIVLILTWLKTAEIQRAFSSAHVKGGSISSLIQRDGTVYFLTLLVLNVVNLIAIKFQDYGCIPALTEVLSSILISRFLLNLRGVYLSDSELQEDAINKLSTNRDLGTSQLSSLRFSYSIAGNLGAPLNDLLSDAYFDGGSEHSSVHDDVAYISANPLAVGFFVDHAEDEDMTPDIQTLKEYAFGFSVQIVLRV